MTQFPKPDSKKQRRARERARQKRRRKFQRDVLRNAPYEKCENRDCNLKAVAGHHIILKRPDAPELDVITNGIALCSIDHNFVHNGTGSQHNGESGKEWMLMILEPYIKELKSVKYWQWKDVFKKLKSGDLT